MSDASAIQPGLPFRINLRRVNKVVGYIAAGLPLVMLLVTWVTGACFNESISHYYYTRIGGDLFVGALCTIGATLLFFYLIPDGVDGYLRHHTRDMIALRVAGLAAFGIALVPAAGTGCAFDGEFARAFLGNAVGSVNFPFGTSPVTGVIGFNFWSTFGIDRGWATMIHFGSALVMFLVLAYFSLVVFTRPQSARAVDTFGDLTDKKRVRNTWYRALGILILFAIAAIALGSYLANTSPAFDRAWATYRGTFVFEAMALMSFGLSWLIKGRFIGYFEDA